MYLMDDVQKQTTQRVVGTFPVTQSMFSVRYWRDESQPFQADKVEFWAERIIGWAVVEETKPEFLGKEAQTLTSIVAVTLTTKEDDSRGGAFQNPDDQGDVIEAETEFDALERCEGIIRLRLHKYEESKKEVAKQIASGQFPKKK